MDENIKKKVDESWKEKAKEEPQEQEGQEKGHKYPPEPDFRLFITSLAMQAWIALGAIPNPVTDKTEEDLSQAKFLIDSLEMLDKKTKGNLDKEEAEMLEHLLYELRMAFIGKTSGEKIQGEGPV